MKSSFKVVSCILFLSFMLHTTGISAKTITFLSDFRVPAWAKGIEVDTLTKTIDGPERVYLRAYFNRDLHARIVSKNSDYNGDSGYYWKLTIKDGFNTAYLGSDLSAAASTYAYFTGDKTLHLKTSGFWYDTTSVSGQWYVNG